MRNIVLFIIIISTFTFAQQSETVNVPTDTLTVTENVYDCVDQVYGSTNGIKLLMQRLINDKKYMREVQREIMKDPELRKSLQDFMRTNRGMMQEDQLNRNDVQDDQLNRNDQENQIQQDEQNQDEEQLETDDRL